MDIGRLRKYESTSDDGINGISPTSPSFNGSPRDGMRGRAIGSSAPAMMECGDVPSDILPQSVAVENTPPDLEQQDEIVVTYSLSDRARQAASRVVGLGLDHVPQAVTASASHPTLPQTDAYSVPITVAKLLQCCSLCFLYTLIMRMVRLQLCHGFFAVSLIVGLEYMPLSVLTGWAYARMCGFVQVNRFAISQGSCTMMLVIPFYAVGLHRYFAVAFGASAFATILVSLVAAPNKMFGTLLICWCGGVTMLTVLTTRNLDQIKSLAPEGFGRGMIVPLLKFAYFEIAEVTLFQIWSRCYPAGTHPTLLTMLVMQLVANFEVIALVGCMSIAKSTRPVWEEAIVFLIFLVLGELEMRNGVKKSLICMVLGRQVHYNAVEDLTRCTKLLFTYTYWVPLLALIPNVIISAAGLDSWKIWFIVVLFTASQLVADTLHVCFQRCLHQKSSRPFSSYHEAYQRLSSPGEHCPFTGVMDMKDVTVSTPTADQPSDQPSVLYDFIGVRFRKRSITESFLITAFVLTMTSATLSTALAAEFGECGVLIPMGVGDC